MIKKRDLILAAFIGLANGFFFWFILNQINKGFPFDWLLIMTICPFLGALGLFLANLIGKKIAVVYQVAKFFFNLLCL